MMSADEARAILEPAATRVRDPVSGRSVWMAGLIQEPTLEDGVLAFSLRLVEEHTAADADRLEQALLQNVQGTGFKGEVRCSRRAQRQITPKPAPKPTPNAVRGMGGGGTQPHGGPFVKQPIPGVNHVIAVASGKGGVGKSTIATNLAIGLSKTGLRVGLMDADIYGPSVPTMMNVHGRPLANTEKKIIPLEAYGIPCMSMGFLVPDKEAVIWRGPMVMGAVRQFLHEVAWGELDVLVVDMPPGTGDAQLTMVQAVPLSGAIIVTTPQQVSVIDAERAITMFRKLEVPIVGLIENMSWMELPNGDRTPLFGEGGGVRTAESYGVPLLAQVPFDATICAGGDAGIPAATRSDGPGAVFIEVAKAVSKALSSGSSG